MNCKNYNILKDILLKLRYSTKDNSTDNNLNETAALKKIMDVVDRAFEREWPFVYKVIIYIYY